MNDAIKAELGCVAVAGGLFSIAVGLLACLYVGWGGGAPFHMLMATFLGAGLSTWVGIVLMALVFLSNRHHDDEAGKQR